MNAFENFRLCKPAGNVTECNGWLNESPKVSCWRLLGKVTPSILWLNWTPKVKLRKVLGRDTRFRLWLNSTPNVKLKRLLGKVIVSICKHRIIHHFFYPRGFL